MPAAWPCGRICLGPQCFPQLWLVLLLLLCWFFHSWECSWQRTCCTGSNWPWRSGKLAFPFLGHDVLALLWSVLGVSQSRRFPPHQTSEHLTQTALISLESFQRIALSAHVHKKNRWGFFRSDGEDAEGVLQGGCKTRPGSDLEAQGPQGPIKDYYYFHKCLCQLRTSWHADLFTNWLMGLLRRSSQSRTSMLEDFSLTRQLAPNVRSIPCC